MGCAGMGPGTLNRKLRFMEPPSWLARARDRSPPRCHSAFRLTSVSGGRASAWPGACGKELIQQLSAPLGVFTMLSPWEYSCLRRELVNSLTVLAVA